MALDELQISWPFVFAQKFSSNNIVSGNRHVIDRKFQLGLKKTWKNDLEKSRILVSRILRDICLSLISVCPISNPTIISQILDIITNLI